LRLRINTDSHVLELSFVALAYHYAHLWPPKSFRKPAVTTFTTPPRPASKSRRAHAEETGDEFGFIRASRSAMIIRIGRPLRLRNRMLRKIFESKGDCLFQLRIVSLAHRLRVLLDDDIGVYAVVFHVPFPLR
jgi:hypothetical protein